MSKTTIKVFVHVPAKEVEVEVDVADVIENLLHNISDLQKWNMLGNIVNHLQSNAHELDEHHRAMIKSWLKKKTQFFNETSVSQK